MLQQYLISIDARLRLRNSTVSVKKETTECLVARNSIIMGCLYKKKSRLFMYILNNTQIYFSDSGRFLCLDAYFGASIHLILFYFSNHGKKIYGKQNQQKCGIYKRHFLYAQLKFVSLIYNKTIKINNDIGKHHHYSVCNGRPFSLLLLFFCTNDFSKTLGSIIMKFSQQIQYNKNLLYFSVGFDDFTSGNINDFVITDIRYVKRGFRDIGPYAFSL